MLMFMDIKVCNNCIDETQTTPKGLMPKPLSYKEISLMWLLGIDFIQESCAVWKK